MSSSPAYKISTILLAMTGLLLSAYGGYLLLNPQILIQWSTATEFETAGYLIYRTTERGGDFERITKNYINASPDPLLGGQYEFIDTNVQAGQTYFYLLEEIESSGSTNREGPIEATATYRGLAEAGLGLVMILFAFFTWRLRRAPAEPILDEARAA